MEDVASAADALLGMLAADVLGLPEPVLVDQLVELSRLIERLQAARLIRLAALDALGIGHADFGGSTVAWLRAVTNCSPSSAGRDVRLARDLADLPATRTALADGRIVLDHARVIAGLRKDLTADAVAAAEPHLVEAATRHDPCELRGWVAHVRHAYAADRVMLDEQTAYDAREMTAATTFQGTGVGCWTLPPVLHETVMTAIHAFSAPIGGDDRTPAQRRADALVTIAELALKSGVAPEAGGVKPHVTVLVPLATLEERAGAAAASYGFGATSSSEWARRMCCDAAVARVITGPLSEVLDAGRAIRCFTAAQTRAIVARDRHCRWPGCNAPPSWAEGHHIKHWADGGATSVDNAVLLCGRHHDRLHAHRHAVVVRADGSRTVDLRPGSAMETRAPASATGPP